MGHGRKSREQTLKQLVGLKERKAEQALAAVELELQRVRRQIQSIELSLLDNRTETSLSQLIAYRAGNRFVENKIREKQRLEQRQDMLLKQREAARFKLKRAICSRMILK